MKKLLIPDPPRGLRERARADGSTRIWWEPPAAAARMGVKPVELEEARLTWSRKQAERLNREADRTVSGGGRKGRARGGRSISALIGEYRKSVKFTKLKDATRRSYESNLRIIEEKWGPATVADFDKPTVWAWYNTNVEHRGATAAVRITAMMSILFSYAELLGWRPERSNPAFNLDMAQPKPRKRIATWEEIDALLDSSAELGLPSIGTATLLGVLQGQRLTDVLAARCEDFPMAQVRQGDMVFEARAWRVDRSKRNTLGLMQLHPLVAGRVEALIEAQGDGPLLITEDSGEPYDADRFSNRWGKVRAHAAKTEPSVASLWFKDLRRTFGVWARSGGASDDDTADVLGNSAAIDPRLQETYMPPSFETASRAVLSIRRPEKKRA